MKAFADERRKRKVAKLQVAGCARNRLYSMLWTGFCSKTQPATFIGLCFLLCICSCTSISIYCIYILLYMYIYLYIIYNIIKNKKKEPTHRVAHTHTEKTIYNKGCGLRFWPKSALQHAVDGIWSATRNLQLETLVAF